MKAIHAETIRGFRKHRWPILQGSLRRARRILDPRPVEGNQTKPKLFRRRVQPHRLAPRARPAVAEEDGVSVACPKFTPRETKSAREFEKPRRIRRSHRVKSRARTQACQVF